MCSNGVLVFKQDYIKHSLYTSMQNMIDQLRHLDSDDYELANVIGI